MEKRKSERFSVRFRSSFSASNMVAGEGMVTDLSLGGCRIESDAAVKPGTVVEVRMELAEKGAHLYISMAVVRWKKGNEFGLEFLKVAYDAEALIRELLEHVGGEPTPEGS